MHTGALTLYKDSNEHSIAEDHEISVKRTKIFEVLPRLEESHISKHQAQNRASCLTVADRLQGCGHIVESDDGRCNPNSSDPCIRVAW